ncbi:MAG: alpha/beta hydrolase [Planctomycetota bacterium]|nr:alpha/beta hydrolase [Planctomycetota bacterium]
MKGNRLRIRLEEGGWVSGVRLLPDDFRPRRSPLIVLAHGAGSDMDHPFLVELTRNLAHRGIGSLRFNFPYRQARRGFPDPMSRLLMTYRCVLERVSRPGPFQPGKTIIGGRSMGGRVASLLVSQGERLDGLLLLAYPLHPPGQPSRLRRDHFPDIEIPTCVIQGTRDRFSSPELLRESLALIPGPVRVIRIEGADHSFQVLRRSGKTEEEVFRTISRSIATWVNESGASDSSGSIEGFGIDID